MNVITPPLSVPKYSGNVDNKYFEEVQTYLAYLRNKINNTTIQINELKDSSSLISGINYVYNSDMSVRGGGTGYSPFDIFDGIYPAGYWLTHSGALTPSWGLNSEGAWFKNDASGYAYIEQDLHEPEGIDFFKGNVMLLIVEAKSNEKYRIFYNDGISEYTTDDDIEPSDNFKKTKLLFTVASTATKLTVGVKALHSSQLINVKSIQCVSGNTEVVNPEEYYKDDKPGDIIPTAQISNATKQYLICQYTASPSITVSKYRRLCSVLGKYTLYGALTGDGYGSSTTVWYVPCLQNFISPNHVSYFPKAKLNTQQIGTVLQDAILDHNHIDSGHNHQGNTKVNFGSTSQNFAHYQNTNPTLTSNTGYATFGEAVTLTGAELSTLSGTEAAGTETKPMSTNVVYFMRI